MSKRQREINEEMILEEIGKEWIEVDTLQSRTGLCRTTVLDICHSLGLDFKLDTPSGWSGHGYRLQPRTWVKVRE